MILPVSENKVSLLPPFTSSMAHFERFSVIVVDDDPVTNYLTSAVLRESALFSSPLVFSNAQEALHHISHHCLELKSHPLPHLLLIDINMPDLDGFEFVESLQGVCSDILLQMVVCVLSTSSHCRDLARSKDLGLDCFINKPLDSSNLDFLLTLLQNRVLG
jgi:CheY-like chemotaxis protein